MRPDEIKRFEEWLEGHKDKAKKKAGRLHRVAPGWYLIFRNNELVELNRLENGEWIAREYNHKWYSDPQLTLRNLKLHIGVEKGNNND